MSRDSEELRQDIAQTRQELSDDVDAIVDRVSPSQIAHRQSEKIKGTFHRAKDAVMGSGESASDQAHDAIESAKEGMNRAPQRVVEQTRGNPLAAGLIAFGAGLLASSLLPATDREGEMAQKLKEKAEPLTHELTESAKQVAEDMKEPVKNAAEELKDSAQSSVESVKEEASGEVDDLQSQAKDKAQGLSDNDNR